MGPEILSAAIAAAPQTAILAYLVILIKQVMGHATVDRGDYRADLDAAEERHAAEMTRLRDAYSADLSAVRESAAADVAAVRAELAEVRQRLTDVYAQLDQERRARWRAEDVAAEVRRSAVTTTDPEAGTPPHPLGR
ncbi:hypothetical protein [Saccharothrix australiensis]|uniref:Uncharacterized protein n=1 Tax=Saccharothrix australiensis TaxID=2072 RepID=A0A495VLF5_9PSEU|nr:hypothetical protein [Saccharothrix australiensis]RKT49367.1 hypothetical protein C8E97_6746 [Saccharothrix australiensis]